MALGYLFVIVGSSLLVQGWREVYRTSRVQCCHDRVVQRCTASAVHRHFLALFGQLVHWPTIITAALFPIIVWAYPSGAPRREPHD